MGLMTRTMSDYDTDVAVWAEQQADALRRWRDADATGDLPDMTPKLPKLLETPNRAPALTADWATAATEARRQRDAEAKAARAAKQQRSRQERAAAAAWSPVHEIPRIRRT
jgi:hypothetical protein